jgi:AcrR family transcriptional regulator
MPTRKSEQTRQLILDSALRFLWSNPFRNLTITRLMADTGITRPAFYHYFTDLHDLMEALLLELQQELQSAANEWFSEGGISNLVDALSAVVEICYNRGPILRAVVEAAPMDERLEAAWEHFVRQFETLVAAGIKREQASGLARDVDPEITGTVLNRMNIATIVHYFGHKPRQRKTAVSESLADIWISTLYGDPAWVSYQRKVSGGNPDS